MKKARKKLVKSLMSKGWDRNTANSFAIATKKINNYFLKNRLASDEKQRKETINAKENR